MIRFVCSWTALVFVSMAFEAEVARADDLHHTIRAAQRKVVKIYGAGGLRQMEAYQSGILISAEGHVLTSSSYVLDTDDLIVILDDGRQYEAEFLGNDPITELAVLELRSEDAAFEYFDLKASASIEAKPGWRVMALSNLYGIATGDEPVSVLQGVVTAVAPLKARRGAFQTRFTGEVYIVDAYANNPGAAGGALVDWQGRLLGVLGKELRSELTGTWLNYALPTRSFLDSVEAILAGEQFTPPPDELRPETSLTLEELGIRLVPDVLARTPPYVDAVRRDSPADEAGLRPDDLIVFFQSEPIASRKQLAERLQYHDATELVNLGALRDGRLMEFPLQAEPVPSENR